MSNLVTPHGGGPLQPLLLPEYERQEELKRAANLTQVPMSSRELSDLLMLGMGAYTPLYGFLGASDWKGSCGEMKLADGLFWPIPITLSAEKELADSISEGEDVALCNHAGDIFGVLNTQEKYSIDKEFECQHVYRTLDEAHPGVQKVMEQGAVNLAGPVKVLDEDHYPETYEGLYFRPAETRALFESHGWSSVAAFQTRNPMHRSHEYLAKIAVEICDGVMIHQVLGALKPGDIPAEVRVRAIDALVKNYFVEGSVIQAGYPIEMRYGGPREALLHALFRQNFGCSHLVVGRDHAGVGSYYGPFDAHHIFDTLEEGALRTLPLKIDITFYCNKCEGMATGKTCPHDESERLNISGTRLREMFAGKEDVPGEFSRAEVLEVLREYYDSAG
ncbi:MAG: sulfate adenylyltransferase [Rhodospirillales bacterium]|jgi:sulfate adenylyltransferase|nr:sulfate adenylyltransferase [Rhodospirillaceae bacterium]MDP6428211.1 sulfate adenylyltransferase [Rhodospirillales bacterium]MDP6642906.1 sulfate adenylyltransferase [Rhodospirillales bacterium]MDP6841453.1 sulfate adenylyltransferase [Rhodospirillales bacterium]|tara:strand:+ start:845 stop:2014 length:1170 start_codon:yes stop_codon:yes gene_type:complete